MAINETVLEMHFHHALMDLFVTTLGIAPKGQVSFYKYSPQRECFVGFDQAWVMSEASDEELFRDLKAAALSNSYQLSGKYAGYFLQYKVMRRMVNASKAYPAPFIGKPYGRVQIDNQENPNTKKSQHELLFELSKNKNALVYYACPALFDKADLYCANANLNELHLVELGSCTSTFKDNKKHHIFFEFPSMSPTWCSDPIDGRSIPPQRLAELIRKQILEFTPGSAENLLDLIGWLQGLREQARSSRDERDLVNETLQALTIVKLKSSEA